MDSIARFLRVSRGEQLFYRKENVCNNDCCRKGFSMKKNSIFLLLVLFLSSCNQLNQASTLRNEQVVDFSNVDAREIIYQPGDFPTDFEPGQFEYSWPADTGIPMKVTPDDIVVLNIHEIGDSFNIPHYSMLALFNDIDNATQTYSLISRSFEFEPSDSVIAGEKSEILHYEQATDLLTLTGTLLIYQRCNAVVVVRVFNWDDEETISYAMGLDKRIKEVACK